MWVLLLLCAMDGGTAATVIVVLSQTTLHNHT